MNSFQPPAQAQVILAESHFDNSTNGTEGWQGIDTGDTHETLVWVSDAASGGGYISMRETKGDGQVMYFWAPPAFLGSQRAAYGGHLTFRIRQLNTDQLGSHANVILQSGSLSLVYGSVIPGTTWMRFDVPLNENTGWSVQSTGQEATQAQLLTVLSEVQNMRICGEWSTRQQEQTDLDDVVLYAGLGPFITQQPVTLSVIQGQTASFNVIAEGDPPLNYQWRFNATNSVGQNTNTYTVTATDSTNAGGYDVVVSDASGSVTSAVATLTVLTGSDCVPPPAGLVSWWPGNVNAKDIQGTNSGLLRGGATFASGEVGIGFSLNGVDAFIEVPDSSLLYPGTNSFSLDAWIKTTNAVGTQSILTRYENGGANSGTTAYSDYELYLTDGKLIGFLRDTDSGGPNSGGQELDGTSDVADGQLHHVALVRDIQNNQMRLYLDGAVEASAAIDPNVRGAIKDDDGRLDPLFIGATPLGQVNSSYTHYFKGIIDDVHYWNRALSIADVQAIFNAGSEGMCKPPVPTDLTTPTRLANGSLQFAFANSSGALFSVLATTNPALPLSNWTVLGGVTEISPGQFQFTDPQATNYARRFYRVLALGTNNPVPPGMALIPAGSFTMGNCMGTNEGDLDELPLHSVYVSAFYMDTNLVTYSLWANVYQWATSHGYSFDHAGSGKAGSHPVQTVNWYDVVKWCNARSEMGGLTSCYYTNASLSQMAIYRSGQSALSNNWVSWVANGYRLPTEAEWEKAARGGASGHRFPWPDADTITWSRANYYAYAYPSAYSYDVNPTEGPHPTFAVGGWPYTSPIGYFAPNGYGLYDMAGNVWEWCWDWNDSYSSGSQSNPLGPTSGSHRVIRGGGWAGNAFACRVADRNDAAPAYWDNWIGFRCVLSSGQP